MCHLQLGDDDKLDVESFIHFPGEDDVEAVYNDEQLVQLVTGGIVPGLDSDNEGDQSDDGEVEMVDANDVEPQIVSLSDARRHAQLLAIFMADNANTFSAADELSLQRISNKVNCMAVANVARKQQARITDFFAARQCQQQEDEEYEEIYGSPAPEYDGMVQTVHTT
jgi:hypothetical protein